MYRIDAIGPAVGGVNTAPSYVRQGRDLSITLTATADDTSAGGSSIVGAEYFIGADPGAGDGTSMSAADGAFDSATESLTAVVNVSAWALTTYQVHVRARDAAGNWGSVATKLVSVVDGVAPGAVTDFTVAPVGSLEGLSISIEDASSQAAGAPVFAIIDGNAQSFWQTEATLTPKTEYVVLDCGSQQPVEALLLAPGPATTLFPTELAIAVSPDNSSWTQVVCVKALKTGRAGYLWQWEPIAARYVRISGPDMFDEGAGNYCWQIANASLYTGGNAIVHLSWTAPADNGFTGTAAAAYDVRCSISPITAANFDSATPISGVGTPAAAGTKEHKFIRLDVKSGRLYFAMTTLDAVSNASEISNVVNAPVYVTGFSPGTPADETVASVDAPPAFTFAADPNASPAYIVFSSSAQFVPAPTVRDDGQTDSSLRIALKAGASSFTPTDAQWTSMKKIVTLDAVLWWRLEGPMPVNMAVFGPPRMLVFESGDIADLGVDGAHDVGGDDAVWPDPVAPPTLEWTDVTVGMKYFYVDVSIDPDVPPVAKSAMISVGAKDASGPQVMADLNLVLAGKGSTVVVGGKGIPGSSYTLSKSDWQKVRKLATLGRGKLYWRVVARDAKKALTTASKVKTLIINGGEWTLSDINLSDVSPLVEWTHAGAGLAKYGVEFSPESSFPAKKMLKLPASTTATSYAFKPTDVVKLQKFAAKYGVVTLYYRVRGEDAQKAFITWSDVKIVTMP